MSKVYIIAEAGVNHNGKLDLALKLVDEAKAAGADAVKFQTYKTEKIITKTAPLAEYQKINYGSDGNQFSMLKKLELSYNEFRFIKEYCDKKRIDFLSTPDEKDSLDFLVDVIKLKTIKIGSGEINNLPFLKQIGAKKVNVILSTGISTLEEVEKAIGILQKYGAKSISVLHCTTDYPTKFEDVNLLAMMTMGKTFRLPIGYSDHTVGIEVPIAATALGAKIIEKHFTLDSNMTGPDHSASVETLELKKMIQAIRNIEIALGRADKQPTESELRNKLVIRKSIVAGADIKRGELFSEQNLTTMRPGGGLDPMEWDHVIGKVAQRDYFKDEMIEI